MVISSRRSREDWPFFRLDPLEEKCQSLVVFQLLESIKGSLRRLLTVVYIQTARSSNVKIPIRPLLLLSAVFNLGGAALFFYPDSLGALAGLPAEVPMVYRAFVATFVLLFGGLYAWLAMQPVMHRPMVAFSAIGKASACALVLTLWVLGEADWRGVLAVAGDGLLAALYFAWLRQTR